MPSFLVEGGTVDAPAGLGFKPGFGITWGNDCPLHTWQEYPGATFAAALMCFGAWTLRDPNATITSGGITMSGASNDDYHTFTIGGPVYDTTNGGTGSSVSVGAIPNDIEIGSGAINPIPFLFTGHAMQAYIGIFQPGIAGTGLQAITGVGFQPDIVIFASNDVSGGSGNNLRVMIGVMDAAGNQWVESLYGISESGPGVVGGIYGENKRYSEFRTDSCILGLRDDNATQGRNRAVFSSMDADGFTVDVTESNANYGGTLFMALKVNDPTKGFFQAGTMVQGDTSVTGMPLPPTGVYFCGDSWSPTLDTPDGFFGMDSNRAVLCQGGTDGVTQRSTIGGAGKGSSSPYDYYDDASITFGITDGQVITARATSVLTSDGFTLTWTDDDSGFRPFGYIAFDVPNGINYGPPSAIALDRIRFRAFQQGDA